MTGHGRLLVVSVLSLIASISCTKKTESSRARDTQAFVCGTFEGGKTSAVWSECPDKVRREVRCAPFIDDLKCDCYEDGVRKWFFSAKDPPLEPGGRDARRQQELPLVARGALTGGCRRPPAR
jgi:hypothetical protein